MQRYKIIVTKLLQNHFNIVTQYPKKDTLHLHGCEFLITFV